MRIGLRPALAFLLIAATVATFWPLGAHDFIRLDDNPYILKNPYVNEGLTTRGIVWAFTVVHSHNWMPLTWLSHMVDCELFGLDPKGHHLSAVFFHALNVALVFLTLNRLTGAVWRSAFVAALFAVHPLQVESVAWVSERKNLLSTCFWMLTLWAYARFADQPTRRRYLLTLLTFALGLLTKPMLVTLPCVLLLLDYWPLGRIGRARESGRRRRSAGARGYADAFIASTAPLVREKIPFFALSFASSVFTIVAQEYALRSVDVFPITVRFANAVVSYVRYIEKMGWPQDLAFFYPHPGYGLPTWQVVGAGLILALVSTVAMRAAARYPYLPTGWWWYIGTLVPVIGIVQVGDQAMADRYTYVPLIGLYIVVTWTAADLCSRIRQRTALFTAAAAVTLAALTVATRFQIRPWSDNTTLYLHTVDVTDRSYRSYNDLLARRLSDGYIDVDQALAHYSQMLRARPNDALAHNHLAEVLAHEGRTEQAIAHFSEAVRLEPRYVKAHVNAARILSSQGHVEQAASHLRHALEANPDDANVLNNLGTLLAEGGDLDAALRYFRASLRVNPHQTRANSNVGETLVRKGRLEEAEPFFLSALTVSPADADAHNSLGSLYGAQGKLDEAVTQYYEALRVNPGFVEAHNNLATILFRQGKIDEAAAHLTEALRIDPDFAPARENLEAVRQRSGSAPP